MGVFQSVLVSLGHSNFNTEVRSKFSSWLHWTRVYEVDLFRTTCQLHELVLWKGT